MLLHARAHLFWNQPESWFCHLQEASWDLREDLGQETRKGFRAGQSHVETLTPGVTFLSELHFPSLNMGKSCCPQARPSHFSRISLHHHGFARLACWSLPVMIGSQTVLFSKCLVCLSGLCSQTRSFGDLASLILLSSAQHPAQGWAQSGPLTAAWRRWGWERAGGGGTFTRHLDV